MRNLDRRRFVQRSLALAAAAAAGCNGSKWGGPRGNTLRLAYATDYRSLDPAILNDMNTIPVAHVIHQTLLDYDDSGNLVPVLAEDLPQISEDGFTYTFRIRSGIHFSTGRELTATDFVTAWKRVLDPKTKSPNGEYLNGLVGAKEFIEDINSPLPGLQAPDAHTLVVRLEKPDHNFLFVTAMILTAPVPAEEVKARGADYFRLPVGTGPYMVGEWQRSLRLVLERNPHYSTGPKPGPDRIAILLGYDVPTQLMMFERGELDSIVDIPASDFPRLRKDPRWEPLMTKLTESSTYFLVLNCELEPFTNPLIRQAFALAINRDRIIRAMNGRGVVAFGPIPPEMPGYNDKPHGYDYNPERARALLKEAGYQNKDNLVLWLPSSNPDSPKVGESVQQDLDAIGVKISLNIVAYEIFVPTVSKRHEVPFSFTGWMQDYPDPSTFIDMIYNGDRITEDECNNVSFLNDPDINALIDKACKADVPVRYDLFREAELAIIAQCPAVYLYHPLRYFLHQPWVSGVKMDPIWLTRYDRYVLEPS